MIGTALAVIIFIALVASAESIIRNLVPKNQFPTALLSTDLPPTQLPSKPATILAPTATNTPQRFESDIATIPVITATESENGISPSGQVAFASDRDGIPQIFLLNLSDSSITKLTNLAGGACQPDWSPSGDKLVIVSPCSGDSTPHKNSSLFIINADGSGLTGIKTMPGGDYDPDWSPDGSRIIFHISER